MEGRGRKEAPPHIGVFTKQLTNNIYKFFHPRYDKKAEQLDEIVKFKEHLNPMIKEELTLAIQSVEDRLRGYRESLGTSPRPALKVVGGAVED